MRLPLEAGAVRPEVRLDLHRGEPGGGRRGEAVRHLDGVSTNYLQKTRMYRGDPQNILR